MISNVTNIDLTWQDQFAIFDDYVWMKVIQVIVPIFVLILGTGLLLGMISFEKYGEDPRKRGLFNQLLSQLFSITILSYWIIIPFRIFRLMIAPLNPFFYWIWATILSYFTYSAALCTTEYSIIKFFSIVVKKQVLPLADDFFGLFFWRFNAVISMWMFIISSFTKGFRAKKFKVIGLPDLNEDSRNLLAFR